MPQQSICGGNIAREMDSRYPLPVTGRLSSQGERKAQFLDFLCCQPKQAVQYTVKLTAIWDIIMLVWYLCNVHNESFEHLQYPYVMPNS